MRRKTLAMAVWMTLAFGETIGLTQNLPPPLVPPNLKSAPSAEEPPAKNKPAPESKIRSNGIRRPTANLPKPEKGCSGQIAVMDPGQITVTDFATDRSCTFLVGTYDIANFDIGDAVVVDVDKGTNTVQKMEKETK